MDSIARIDYLLQIAKRCQRAYYRADYRKLAKKLDWYQTAAGQAEQARVRSALRSQSPKEILIFKPDDIGDAIYALPAISELKKQLPSSRLSLLCQKKTVPLYERSQLFDQIVAVDVRVRGLRFQSFDLDSALRQFSVPHFDLAVFLRTYPAFFREYLKVPTRMRLHPMEPRLHSDSPYQAPVSLLLSEPQHQSIQLLQLIALVTGWEGTSTQVSFPKFQFTSEDETELRRVYDNRQSPDYFVLHPFAKFETRRYPEKYWKQLLTSLRAATGANILIIGAGEDAQWKGIEGVIQLQGKLTLGATGLLLSQAKGFIGNESGPGHWASAMGIPTAFLMSGHSDTREWGPVGKALVLNSVVDCSPCYLRACPKYKVKCLTQLTPELIWPRLSKYFAL